MALSQAERRELIGRYERGPGQLREAFARVPEEARTWRPGPGKWSFHEVVIHCADSEANAAARFLFRLRAWMGKAFGWDREPSEPRGSFAERLSPADRESSLVAPGTLEGPFRVLFVSPQEAISEIRNSTVHAFSVFALLRSSPGYRLYWAVYVRPVGPITSWYMRLIDPFRRAIIYPAALRYIQRAWARENPEAAT